MSEELEWELYDIFMSGIFAFPVYEHNSARRIVRHILMQGVSDEDIANAIESHTIDLHVWLSRAGKHIIGEWVIAWLNEERELYKYCKLKHRQSRRSRYAQTTDRQVGEVDEQGGGRARGGGALRRRKQHAELLRERGLESEQGVTAEASVRDDSSDDSCSSFEGSVSSLSSDSDSSASSHKRSNDYKKGRRNSRTSGRQTVRSLAGRNEVADEAKEVNVICPEINEREILDIGEDCIPGVESVGESSINIQQVDETGDSTLPFQSSGSTRGVLRCLSLPCLSLLFFHTQENNVDAAVAATLPRTQLPFRYQSSNIHNFPRYDAEDNTDNVDNDSMHAFDNDQLESNDSDTDKAGSLVLDNFESDDCCLDLMSLVEEEVADASVEIAEDSGTERDESLERKCACNLIKESCSISPKHAPEDLQNLMSLSGGSMTYNTPASANDLSRSNDVTCLCTLAHYINTHTVASNARPCTDTTV